MITIKAIKERSLLSFQFCLGGFFFNERWQLELVFVFIFGCWFLVCVFWDKMEKIGCRGGKKRHPISIYSNHQPSKENQIEDYF